MTETNSMIDDFPAKGPGSRRRRVVFFSVSGVAVVLVLLVARSVLLPFVLAILAAYVLSPVVKLLSRKMPKWAAVIVLYVAIVGGFSGFVAVGVPRIVAEVQKFARETPAMIATARNRWIPTLADKLRTAVSDYGGSAQQASAPPPENLAAAEKNADALIIEPRQNGGFTVQLPARGLKVVRETDSRYRIAVDQGSHSGDKDMETAITEALRRLTENLQEQAFTAINAIQDVVRAVIRGIFGLGIVLMLSAYFLITSDRIFEFFRGLVRPNKRRNFDLLVRRIDRGLSGVIRGQLLIALVNGVLSAIAFYLLDLRYWPILALVATALSIIPIFGAILSSIPAVIIGLQDDLAKAVAVLIAIVVIHQVEANLLNPKIMGDSAKVHPVLIVFALLAGEHSFGIAGALLAVPVLSVAQSLFLHFREVALGIPTPRTLRESQLPPAPPRTSIPV